jgi:signal transduction histidine kinase
LTFDRAFIDAEVNRQLTGIGLVALTTLALGALIAIVLSRTLSRGLKELDTAALAMAEGDFAMRARDDVGPAEIRALSRAFNDMASRVGTLVETQRRFASDASHQLRTPITALMLRVGGLRESLKPGAKNLERLDAIDAELSRLNRLIDGLLTLGRAGSQEVTREVIDASEVSRERLESWTSLAEEAGISLTAKIDKGLLVSAVPTAVEQIVDVFLDNALSVSDHGGKIEVSVVAEGAQVVISVSDEGPGMMPEEISRAFDRFWRGSSGYEGTGLGLAVVKQLAEASGAHVSLTSRAAGGILAQVKFNAPHS